MSGDTKGPREAYLVEAVQRACDIIQAFESGEELLRLRDLAARTGMNKTTAFRTLATLVQRGFVERVGPHQYRPRIRSVRPRRFRIGYCSLGSGVSFSRDVTESIVRVAEEENVDLRVLDNACSPAAALRNARTLVGEKVDLVMEHQADEGAITESADVYLEAQIPMIGIHMPRPGASYFGPDNHRGGQLAGRYAGKWAKLQWEGCVDHVLLVEHRKAGLFLRSRLTGALIALKRMIPEIDNSKVTVVDGHGDYERSLISVRKFLRHRKNVGRTIIFGIDDASAIGALRAFEEAGLVRECAAVGYGGSFEARAEMRRHETRLIASVGCFPERYGDALLPLAIRLLTNRPAPPATFVPTCLITPQDVDHYYPNDVLRNDTELTTLLLGGTLRQSADAPMLARAGRLR